MSASRFAILVLALLGAGAATAATVPHHAKKATHRHLVRREPPPRPMLATVAYQGAGVPFQARVPAPGLDQVAFFSTSFLGDLVLAATVPPPQPECIARRAVAQKTQARPPWAAVGAAPLYCEIVGP